jgi:hypothetical protein
MVESVSTNVKDVMERVQQYLKELYGMDVTVPFPVSMSFGKNLYEQKEI